MSVLKRIPIALVLLAALLLLGGCGGSSCNPYAAYNNGCNCGCAPYADCDCCRCGPCNRQRTCEPRGCPLFY